MNAPLLMLAALALEGLVGWPDAIDRHVGHPVRWFGALLTGAERLANRPAWGRRMQLILGGGVTLALVMLAALIGWTIERLLPDGLGGFALAVVVAAPLLAARSLHDHVAAVARAFDSGGLAAARTSVGMIVGRRVDTLDEAGVARAAIESLAENTSDGVTAPLFWGALFGLPGLLAYKAINTMDSMIGHRNERFEAFGKCAARLDDVVNIVPARLAGLTITLAAVSARPVSVMLRDARKHRSPNAGWPEAAMAGALGIRLSGPRNYGGGAGEEPWLNAGAPDPATADIDRALALYLRAMLVHALLLLAVGLLILW